MIKYLLFFIPAVSLADTDTLNWSLPTEREDNTPITVDEIAGVKIYYGDDCKNLTDETALIAPPDTSITLEASLKSRCYVATAIDTDGRESAFSKSVVMAPGKKPLMAPGLSVTRNVQ